MAARAKVFKKLRLKRRDGSTEIFDVNKTVAFNDPAGTMEYIFAFDRLKGGGHRLGWSTSLFEKLDDFVSLEVVDEVEPVVPAETSHYYLGCSKSDQGNDTTLVEEVTCIDCLKLVPEEGLVMALQRLSDTMARLEFVRRLERR